MKKILSTFAFFILLSSMVNAEVFMCGDKTNVFKDTKDFSRLNYEVDTAYFEVDEDGNHFVSYKDDMSDKVQCENYGNTDRFFEHKQKLIEDGQSYFLATCNMNDPLLENASVHSWGDIIFFVTDIKHSYSLEIADGTHHSYIECISLDD